MAGSHKTGAAAADATLFENAYYIFTPSSLTTGRCHGRVERASEWIGIPIHRNRCRGTRSVTSQISHFPHILASTLVEQAVAYGRRA